MKEVEAADREHRLVAAAPEIDRLERLVSLLDEVEDYQPIAAVYARSVLDRYGDLGALDPDVKRRLDGIRERLDKLTSVEGLKDALPPAPRTP